MGMERGAQKGPQIVLEGKEGLPHPYSRAAPLHARLRLSPALACSTLQLAGAFDFPLQEGRRAGSQGCSDPCPSPSPPALQSPLRPKFSSAAEPRSSNPARSLLQRSHPGHIPCPRGWQGCYFTMILYVFLKILCAAGSEAGTPTYKVSLGSAGCGDQHWVVPHHGGGSVATTIRIYCPQVSVGWLQLCALSPTSAVGAGASWRQQ